VLTNEKPVFRFADTDMRSAARMLRNHEDELTRVLKDTVPGLVQGSAENAVQATLSAVGSDDRLLGTGQHHRLLVHPDAFHVSVLFQPTLSFMDRIAEVLPEGKESVRASSAVLDEFVIKVYLPQLEDKVSELFHNTVTSESCRKDGYLYLICCRLRRFPARCGLKHAITKTTHESRFPYIFSDIHYLCSV
jgi:exocyst complex component 4